MWNLRSSQGRIQTQEFKFRQWTVRLERKAFRRSLSIVLKPDGSVCVRANLKTSDERIHNFLVEKQAWIEKHLNQFEKLRLQFPEKKLLCDEEFPFLGQNLSLRVVPTLLKKVFFSRQERHLLMHIPQAAWDEMSEEDMQQFFPQLKQFYQRESIRLITERLQIWSVQMELAPRKLKFRNQKSRWGSCSAQGIVTMNWRLIGAPLEVVDYVIIHELAHLQHMNHSKSFWTLVERHCLNLKACEDWLKNHQMSLDFLLT